MLPNTSVLNKQIRATRGQAILTLTLLRPWPSASCCDGWRGWPCPCLLQVLLCGIETHVCVLQTTLDLIESGYEVHILVDGVSSQRQHDRAIGLHRATQRWGSAAGGDAFQQLLATFHMSRSMRSAELQALFSIHLASTPLWC